MKQKRCKLLCILMTFIIAVTLFCVPSFAANEKFRSADARRALRIAAMLESTDLLFDYDQDGRVTANDARKILRQAAKLLADEQNVDNELVAADAYAPAAASTTRPASSGYTGGVLSSCGLSESQLAKGLKKSLKGYAGDFLAAEREYGVNAVFLAAIAALESGWGESGVAQSRNNLFGWKGNGGYRYFDTVSACIFHVAKFLKLNYLTPGGSCFHGYEIEDVQRSYCPGGDWASAVRGLMNTILADVG